jgi:hypothetical protein
VNKEWPLMAQGKQPPLEQEAGTPAGWNPVAPLGSQHGALPASVYPGRYASEVLSVSYVHMTATLLVLT